jgi:hypothetical protein
MGSFKLSHGKLYRRASSGDLEFGHICPVCAGPKTDQALLCRRCRADSQVVHGRFRQGVMQGERFRSENRMTNYHGPGPGLADSNGCKRPCLFPLSDGRRCCECDTCQGLADSYGCNRP